MSNDCMASKLAELLWLKGVISTQQYENLFYEDFSRDLSNLKNFKYRESLESYRQKNKIK